MRTRRAHFRLFLLALALTGLPPSIAYCDEPPSTYGQPASPAVSGQPAARAVPSQNNEIFKTLRSKCETDAPCGKANGDVCAEAAAILLGSDRPDEFHDMNEIQRIRIALRLLEKGVDSSNIAASRAYDLYAKIEVLFGLGSGAYADPYRANELMEMMTRKSYPGAALRKAGSAVSFFSMAASESERKQACDLATQLKAGGKLDADSVAVADQVLDSSFCKNLYQVPPK